MSKIYQGARKVPTSKDFFGSEKPVYDRVVFVEEKPYYVHLLTDGVALKDFTGAVSVYEQLPENARVATPREGEKIIREGYNFFQKLKETSRPIEQHYSIPTQSR